MVESLPERIRLSRRPETSLTLDARVQALENQLVRLVDFLSEEVIGYVTPAIRSMECDPECDSCPNPLPQDLAIRLIGCMDHRVPGRRGSSTFTLR